MDFTHLYLVITAQCFLLRRVDGSYSKDITCILDAGEKPICKVTPSARRNDADPQNSLPSYDPYIPQKFEIFYNCTGLTCEQMYLTSLTQITDPEFLLKGCFKSNEEYKCENLRYHHMKNVDKILFLNSNVKDKSYYAVDCLVYDDGGRVCQKKDVADSHIKLVDIGTIARPNETNILSQNEFLCEESVEGYVNCDIIPFVSFDEKLVLRESIITNEKVLLKTGNYVVPLQKNCISTWCGYSGIIIKSARRQTGYEPPGGKIDFCELHGRRASWVRHSTSSFSFYTSMAEEQSITYSFERRWHYIANSTLTYD